MERWGARTGKVVFLEDIIDRGVEITLGKIQEKNPALEDKETIARKVALGAIVFGDLVNDRVKDIVFDWEKILDFEGDTAPYVMFAHVRAKGILRKLEQEGLVPATEKLDPNVLTHVHERGLMVRMGQFRDILEHLVNTNKPHTLGTYLIEVARIYHRFCHDCPVLKAESPVREARVALTGAVATVLSSGLWLLGVPAPERM